MSRLLERLRVALIAFALLAIPAAAAPITTSAAANSESLAPIAMDGGGYVNCAIRTDRTLWCWGSGSIFDVFYFDPSTKLGQNGVNEPQQMGTELWLTVSVGQNNVCGIQIASRSSTQGALYCFGSNSDGQLGINPDIIRASNDFVQVGDESDWTALSVGQGYLCGVRGGELWCIGKNQSGQFGLGDADNRSELTDTGNAATGVTTGIGFSCALTGTGAVKCMGDNGSGQLGNGTTDNSNIPVSVSGNHLFSTLSAGGSFVCAIAINSADYPDDAGKAYCWGENSNRQLGSSVGDSEVTNAYAPRAVSGDLRFAKLQADDRHACGVTTAGALYCWGNNDFQQSGGSVSAQSVMPTRIGTASNWSLVATSAYISCAATTSTARVPSTASCWGDRTFIGNGQRSYFNTLAQVPGSDYLQVASSVLTRCAIRGAALPGQLSCWGGNWEGMVGSGSTDPARTPVTLPHIAGWSEISLGSRSACAISGSGTLYCWGRNDHGELGVNDRENHYSPVQVGTDSGWRGISVGDEVACAIRSVAGASSVYCWGSDGNGIVGNGSDLTEDVLTPTAILTVPTGVTVKKVVIGPTHACAVDSRGYLWCWGANGNFPFGWNLLGDGSGVDQPAPVRSVRGLRFIDVAVGPASTCGVTVSGEAWCWGENVWGSLGNGNSLPDFFFFFPGGPSGVTNSALAGSSMVSVSAGAYSNCGIKRGGDLYCWGLSPFGLLPTGTDRSSATPKKVGSGFTSIANSPWNGFGPFDVEAGGCAVKSEGTLWCWGSTYYNALQNGWVDQYGTPQSVKILYRAPTADGDAQITGRAKRGATLTADAPTFSGTPIPALSYQWYRCTAAARTGSASVPRTCSKISGATRSTYVLQSGDVNKYVRLLVTAKSNAGTVTVMSPSTSKVTN